MLQGKHKQESGVTLFEAILVLAISASIFLLSLRQYQVYKRAADAEELKYNVAIIQDAARKYFLSNCNPGGALGPDSTSDTKTIDLSTDMVATGYLPINLFPLNPIVKNGDDNDDPIAGYKLQFIKFTAPRYTCLKGTNVTGPTTAQGCTEQVQTGTIINWHIQVAVKLQDPAYTDIFKNLTNADCAIEWSDTKINDCTSSGSQNALLFTASPSQIGVSETQSGFWIYNPNLLGFKQQYTSAPISYLKSSGHSPEVQYYYCGS